MLSFQRSLFYSSTNVSHNFMPLADTDGLEEPRFERNEELESNLVKKLLSSESFRSYMLNTYQIVPMLINRRRIRHFLEMTQEFQQYVDHIEQWNK